MSLYDQDFLNTLPVDPKIGHYNICQYFLAKGGNPINHQYCLEAFALMDVYISDNQLEYEMPTLPPTSQTEFDKQFLGFVQTISGKIRPYVIADEHERKLHNLRKGFSNNLNKVPVYEFTEGDLTRIQDLLNRLRVYLSESNEFALEHKRRLMLRLEKLQAELHKKQSDFDHYWGLFIDSGIALGKFGKEAKPFVEMMAEIKEIIWSTQSRAEELPSGSKPPMLDHD